MKKIVFGAVTLMLLAVSLCACGSKECNMCGRKCSGGHSYANGEIVLCDSCYHDCFKDKTEVDDAAYFAELEQSVAEAE